MGFFERPDPRLIQSADPTPIAAVMVALKRHALALVLSLVIIVAAYAGNVEVGMDSAAATSGNIVVPGLYAPVTIVRDRRDIPHIMARNEHDLYFGEGYAQGSDRLFQLDLTRRYAYGRLAEVFGSKTLALDKGQRAVGIAGIAARQLRALARSDLQALVAFSDGINAAAATQPLPVEFRILLYRPAPWTPKDSLAVSVVASLELADPWANVLARDAVWRRRGPRCFDRFFPLSDASYDVSIDGVPNAPPTRARAVDCAVPEIAAMPRRPAIGSNAWAAGARRTVDGHALIANDPHLDLTIPGIWYLVDIQSPHIHAAGATIPGIPGVALGHNERFAWASTNAEMATTSVFSPDHLNRALWVTERFRVRFAHDATAAYYRTSREFSVPYENHRLAIALVRWPVYAEKRSSIATVLALDRAHDVREGLRVLANYRGPPQNFILADRGGDVAYHVAGVVPNDPAWGRYVHNARDLRAAFAPISFDELPQRSPALNAILLSANNKAYAPAYRYRLSAQFEPPYRAHRIAELLRSRARYDAAYFARMQLDTLSPIDMEIAGDLVRYARTHRLEQISAKVLSLLNRWDGRYQPDSRAAALEHAFRMTLFQDGPAFDARLSEVRHDPNARARDLEQDIDGALFGFDDRRLWRDDGGVYVEHPLAPMNVPFLNGAWLPGAGDEFTIRLQEPGFAQGFRAVWDVGNWDRGGIAIPSGESGEPGSGHYTDLAPAWVDGLLQPLPFSRAAIRESASNILLIRPF